MSKKQLLSSQTVLLRGAGRTNIEYSAGPNINITDDVISGRDWSQEMAQIVKGGVSAALSGGNNIEITNDQGVNIISVTGDLYSAGPNIDITDRIISGKDWTDDIDSHIASAISGKADSSAIPEIVEYSAGDNINITDHVVSGKDWTYEIGQKVGRDEFVSGMSAVTEHMTEVVSATSGEIIDIISATSGQGGGSCPWISGGKDYGSATEQLQFGSVLPIFSSWGLCADHNHYIWMKGAYIRLPDIDPYLSSYLPLSSFSSYTASTYNWLSAVNALANSAYTTAVNNYHNKLDISAWSAFTADADTTEYSAGNGINITDHVISFTGSEGQTYSAGDNINITNNVISGKSWTDEIIAAVSGKQPSGDYYSASNPSGFITSAGTVNKLDISSFTVYTAAHSGDDNQAYSAGSNINITNHVVSGKDWSNEIASSTSGKLDASWTAGKDVTPYSAGANVNVTNHVISGKDWTQTIDEHIESAISGIEVPSAKPVSGTSGIKVEETENAVVFSISGDVGKTYSAGANINISNSNVISGRDWSTNITSATSGKLDSSWTAGKDVTPYSAGANVNITNHVVSGKDWTTEITSATSGKADKSEIPTVVDYSAGANIDVTDHVISGKDWSDEITAAVESATSGKQDTLIFNYDGDNNISAINGSAIGGQGGTTYTSPSGTLIVDNANSTLEASISGLDLTTHYVDSAVNIKRKVIGSVPQTSTPYKILDNVLSGEMSAAQVGTYLNYATSAWIKDGDGNTLTSFVIPRLDNSQSYTIPYTSTSAGNSLWIKASDYFIGEAYYVGDVYSSVPVTGYKVVDLYNNYSAGSGITIVDHVINASGHEYSAGNGIQIYDDVISVTAGGKTYQGIAPVVVDNELDTVSLGSATWSLSGGTGITLTPNSSINTLVIAATNTADPDNYVLKNSVQCPIGSNVTADATAFGQGTTVKSQSASFAQGNAVSAIGSAFAQGKTVKVQSASFGQGANLDVSGDSFAQGYNITANQHSFGQGENETVSGYSFAQGIWSRAFDMSFAQGYNPYASAYSFAQGSNTVAVCAGQAFGIGTKANGCMAIGKYNSTSADAAFVIGNGTDLNARGDLFVIDNSGNVHAPLGYFYDADGKVGGGGNKITYDYSTPATAYSANGDMLIRYQTSQSTPARTTVWVADSAVGLLAPTAVNHNSFLMQDYRGSTTWVDASAVVPSSMSAQASYFSKTYTSADSGDSSIDDYPEMNRDWTFNIINWKDISIYYSAAQGTATLEPGYGVRVHYDLDSDWLDAEPEYYVGGIGMKYATCDMLDNRNIEYVATSAQATESGVLYIITGSN